MGNIELRIDGEVIVLTSQQTEQLKKAVIKETSVPVSQNICGILMSCKDGKKGSYPLVLSSNAKVPCNWNAGNYSCGGDFSLNELKGFIKKLKAFAAQIWTTAEKELKNV